MRKDSIKISPEHGMNPGLISCFWCGENMGVALYGRIKTHGDKDAAAPPSAIISLEPCDKCREKFGHGIAAICVQKMNDFMHEAGVNFVPKFMQVDINGKQHVILNSYIVINRDAQILHDFFPDEESYEQVMKCGMFYVPKKVFDEMAKDVAECMQEGN